MISNQKINGLIREKYALIRALDNHIITDEEYKSQVLLIDKNIQEEHNKIMKQNELYRDEQYEKLKAAQDKIYEQNTILNQGKLKQEEKHMAEDKAEKAEKPKKEKKISNASLIIKALHLKSTKNVDGVVRKVLEWNPDLVDKAVKAQAVSIIKMVKANHPRFKAFVWDEASFSLSDKE
jgi:hypothetical protein